MPPIRISPTLRSDRLFVGLALLHGAVLIYSPTTLVIAVGVWWTSNTIAHNFIHRPFFRRQSLNVGFSSYLTVLLGVPQALWRQRHLAHHSDKPSRIVVSAQLTGEVLLVVVLWSSLAANAPAFFLNQYIPGYAVGMLLCGLQRFYEHQHGTTSHYGTFYNLLCFNDGYHVEHHANPGVHWSDLPSRIASGARTSRWPPPLRWLDIFSLEGLERLVLCSPWLRRRVLQVHREAFASLIPSLGPIDRIGIVGGGLFPRTALILRALLPHATIVVIDQSAANLDTARSMLDDSIELVQQRYEPGYADVRAFDLLVIPLSFQGNRDDVYRHPPSRALLVQDWIWRRRGNGRRVSLMLLKRVNLVLR